jgi:UDP-glucose 4-epimerase
VSLDDRLNNIYSGQKVLVTGGLGFIGSNLALRLAALGTHVTIVDSEIPGCGANPYNIESGDPEHRSRIGILLRDIRDAAGFPEALEGCRAVFNLAGEISHIHSMQHPERDLEINTVSHLRFLQKCAELAPGVRVVYASTRQVYGVPQQLPVNEAHPAEPVDYNGIHKHATAMYHLMLSRAGALDAVVLRLTNVYGPRMALEIGCQGFLSTYLRRAVLGQELEVFGDGQQLRDPVYVDDAVDAFLLAGAEKSLQARNYNVGGPQAIGIGEIAETIARVAGGISVVRREFPPERLQMDIGSYSSDTSRIRADLGWEPQIQCEEGFRRSLDFYRAHSAKYLDPESPDPKCPMPEHSGQVHTLRLSRA